MPASSIKPMPKPSTPMLLLIVCNPFTPLRTSAAIRFSGTPHSPKPPSMIVQPSLISATALSALATTLFTKNLTFPERIPLVMDRPLDGITVVTLEHAIAAPFCTRQLADLGARVIKIERPDGGDFARSYDERVRGLSSHFVYCNRSKESLALDVKHPAAAGVLSRLLEKADVLVQNLAPGAAARLGLSHERLRDKHPRLIVCDISGYGSDGPYRDKKAYDLLIQSESGFVSVTGTPDEPAKAGCPVADLSAGIYACTNILAALITRGKTGKGCRIDVSMLETTVEWMGHPLYYAFNGAAPPPRTGAAHATVYPYGPFPAGDGRPVMLGLQNEREWMVFCNKVLERPEL